MLQPSFKWKLWIFNVADNLNDYGEYSVTFIYFVSPPLRQWSVCMEVGGGCQSSCVWRPEEARCLSQLLSNPFLVTLRPRVPHWTRLVDQGTSWLFLSSPPQWWHYKHNTFMPAFYVGSRWGSNPHVHACLVRTLSIEPSSLLSTFKNKVFIGSISYLPESRKLLK